MSLSKPWVIYTKLTVSEELEKKFPPDNFAEMSVEELYMRPQIPNAPEPISPSAKKTYLDDPHIQPMEGGYYKCVLCSSVLPGETHISWHLEGKLHKKNVGNASTTPSDPSYFEQFARQFFDTEGELSFGVIGKDQAPAHWSTDMRCELCDTCLYSFDAWEGHFKGKKHVKARRNNPNRLFWQCLCADFPYYYEHISGMWQSTPPKRGHALKNGAVIVVPAVPDIA